MDFVQSWRREILLQSVLSADWSRLELTFPPGSKFTKKEAYFPEEWILSLPDPLVHSSSNVVESSLTSALVDVSLGPDSELLGDLRQSLQRVRLVESQLLVLDLSTLSGEDLSRLSVGSEFWVRVGSAVRQGRVVEAAVWSAVGSQHVLARRKFSRDFMIPIYLGF